MLMPRRRRVTEAHSPSWIPNEPADLDVLARLGRDLLHEIADRLARVAHPRLVHAARRPCRTPAIFPSTIFSIMCSGLPLGLHLLVEDAALATRPFLRHLILVDGERRGRGDVLGELLARAAGSRRCARRSRSRSSARPARRSCRCGGCSSRSRPPSSARPARFSALAAPFERRSSTAFSMSPPVSSSAFLQSIMPAPVRSRSSATSFAVIV